MVGELLTLPLRVGVRATRLWLRVTGESVAVAANAAGQLIDTVVSRGTTEDSVPREAPARREPRPRKARSEAPAREAPQPAPPPPVPAPPPPAPATVEVTEPLPESAEPTHVSEESELVEAFAEPGAEDGAGAEVHVEEPWPGYERMNAKEVISRLSAASRAELAAVELYERGHRGRHTILAAVEREIQGANGGGSRS
jgi:hypothetical protein